jgi:hypothetical protein
LEERVKEAADKAAALEAALTAETAKHAESMAALRGELEQSLEAARRDFGKKSALARTLMQEKEEEVRVLSAKAQELQEEIKSGAPNERRIFQLAQEQAKRETTHGMYRYYH